MINNTVSLTMICLSTDIDLEVMISSPLPDVSRAL